MNDTIARPRRDGMVVPAVAGVLLAGVFGTGPAYGQVRSLADRKVVMRQVNAEAGLGVVFTDGNSHTGGVAWVDYNGDYLPDLFVTNGGGLDHFLFRNEGDGTFANVSGLVTKPDLSLEDAGVLYADIENDGDYDILVIVDNPTHVDPFAVNPVTGGPNLLYVNQGDGASGARFQDVAKERGLGGLGYGMGLSLGDFDNDGCHLGQAVRGGHLRRAGLRLCGAPRAEGQDCRRPDQWWW